MYKRVLALTCGLLACVSVHAAFVPSTLYGFDESGAESWVPTDLAVGNPDTEFDITFRWGDFNSVNTFGLYLMTNAGAIESSLQIFGDGGAGSGTTLWDLGAKEVSTQYGTLDFGNAYLQSGYELGFYFTEGGDRYNSHAALNGGEDFFGIYENTDPFGGYDLALYMSDGECGLFCLGADGYKITVDDAAIYEPFGIASTPPQPVPEPGMLALFGLGVLGMVVTSNRRRKAAQERLPAPV